MTPNQLTALAREYARKECNKQLFLIRNNSMRINL